MSIDQIRNMSARIEKDKSNLGNHMLLFLSTETDSEELAPVCLAYSIAENRQHMTLDTLVSGNELRLTEFIE